MVWALGQLGHRDEVLLANVARTCPANLHAYDSQVCVCARARPCVFYL